MFWIILFSWIVVGLFTFGFCDGNQKNGTSCFVYYLGMLIVMAICPLFLPYMIGQRIGYRSMRQN